ncbi:MAG: CBS domain-containing protein [Bacillota bacterium]|nr:CBS domain-containing protein [Bacillota bacterium]
MEIITSHNAMDFDGLASMVAAGILYPGAVKVFSGTVSKNVKNFLALYKDSLVIKVAKEIDTSQIERMIVVDTANASRLGQLKKIMNDSMDFHVYDHHPPVEDDIKGSIHEVHSTGAATTILVEKIIEKNLVISPLDATILTLGIYDDTGCLLFPSTTPRDAHVVGHLLAQGANLAVVAKFMDKAFSIEQTHILQDLLENDQHYRINNLDVLVAKHEGDAFIPGLDLVCYRLFEMENCDAVFVVAKMEGKINVVGRSKVNELKINEVLKPMGGRGHDKAASAVVKKKTVEEVTEAILENISIMVHPAMVASDIMSTPVKTVPPEFTMEEAGKIMLRYGHTGMPVVVEEKMVGVISRRDVDKAMIHDLGHAPVKGFMTTNVMFVGPDTSVRDVQKLMVKHDIGRLPVIDQDRLAGIVSRTDILRTLHGEDYSDDHKILYSYDEGTIENCSQMMEEVLSDEILHILRAAGEISQDIGSTAYCVGGFVRDLFLHVSSFDFDLVVEGDGNELATRLSSQLGGKLRVHERFGTAVIILENGIKLDIATARTEYYEFPAALPSVERASIREDMYRRDFTINTMAVCLNVDKFGELVDYFGGRKDLQNGCIRILYNLSFVEDPTRILRAIRFEQRYRFTIEADTLRFAKDAIERRMLGQLSYQRILHELILILSERDPVPALERMRETGVWKYILPEVQLDELSTTMLRRILILIGWWGESYIGMPLKSWLVYIMYIFSKLNEEQLQKILNRYTLDRYAQDCIEKSYAIPGIIEQIQQYEFPSCSQLHQLIGNLSNENMVYLLLCLKDENLWKSVVDYLERCNCSKVEINGHDLQDLGLKPGPVFQLILQELYDCKLDGTICSREEELQAVQQWIDEGRFLHGVAD